MTLLDMMVKITKGEVSFDFSFTMILLFLNIYITQQRLNESRLKLGA